MNILYCLRRACRFYGDNTAIIDDRGTLTYREFGDRVTRSAVFLQSLRLEAGDRVALLMANSPQFLELYYSTALAGIIVVPLNTRWNITDIVFSLVDSGSKALIVDERFASLLPQIREQVPGILAMYAGLGACPDGFIDYEQGVNAVDEIPDRWPEPDAEDVAGIFYTSGTTGGPKGAMLTHRNICSNMLLAVVSGLSDLRVFLHAAPMFHLADGGAIHATTNQGGAHCFMRAFDPEAFLSTIETHRVNSSVLIPTMVNMVVNHPAIDQYDISSFEYLLYGGSAMPVPLLAKAKEKLPCRFFQGYGMTETSPLLTILQPEDHELENLDSPFTPVKSGGRPIIGMEVRVVNELDEELPPGEIGEIVARGDNVMKGYWNRPEVNREVLRGGWMHTGDMGAFDADGFLYVLDRKKDMIKTGGENVYSPEVESMLLSHPAVLEAAIIGVPHEVWGEAIRAVVALRAGAQVSEAELIAYCRGRMSHFKCPTSVVFLESLPKSGTAKVQKTLLREWFGGASAASA